MEKKTKQKPKANKPEVVKLPESIFVVRDLFSEHGGFLPQIVGFTYSKEEAEKLAEQRYEKQEQVLARYTLLSERGRFELDTQKLVEIYEEIEKIEDIEGYSDTDTFELKLLKK